MVDLLPGLHLTVEVGQMKPADCLRRSIAVFGREEHRLGKEKARSGCKRPIEVRDFRYVGGYDQ